MSEHDLVVSGSRPHDVANGSPSEGPRTDPPPPAGPVEASAPLIAVCEDDPEIRDLLAAFLAGEEFQVETARNGSDLDRVLGARRIDLIILDWMLPGEDGLAICRRLSARGGPPVLMLTARAEDTDRIAGLETGADGYLAKPFNDRVLLAHVRAVLRRTGSSPAGPERLRVADLLIEPDARRVICGEREALLTAAEFDLLLCFANRAQRVLSRDQLMDVTRGRSSRLFDRTIDVQVSRLRQKLEEADSEVAGLIRAVRNAGYILAAPMSRS